jgi:hypothetical protein
MQASGTSLPVSVAAIKRLQNGTRTAPFTTLDTPPSSTDSNKGLQDPSLLPYVPYDAAGSTVRGTAVPLYRCTENGGGARVYTSGM